LNQGRPAYNEAIASTNAEQLLALIIKMRYGMPSSLMTVASITANIRFSADVNAQVGIGPTENFTGNLVPLSGGVAYDESPTIQYLPVQGEKHLRQLLEPIPLNLLVLLLNASVDPSKIMMMMVSRINRIRNPEFILTGEDVFPARFSQLIALMSALSRADKLKIVESYGDEKKFMLWIHDYTPAYELQVRQLLDLLEIEGVAGQGDDISLPLVWAVRRPTNRTIAVQTRSVYELSRIASAGIDLPEDDRAEGLTIDYPEPGPAGKLVKIHRAKRRPANAVAVTRHRDWWYYIAGNDPVSKQFFTILEALVSVQLAEAAKGLHEAPVLTVPVAR